MTFKKRPVSMLLGEAHWKLMAIDYPETNGQTSVMLDMQDGLPGIQLFLGHANPVSILTVSPNKMSITAKMEQFCTDAQFVD